MSGGVPAHHYYSNSSRSDEDFLSDEEILYDPKQQQGKIIPNNKQQQQQNNNGDINMATTPPNNNPQQQQQFSPKTQQQNQQTQFLTVPTQKRQKIRSQSPNREGQHTKWVPKPNQHQQQQQSQQQQQNHQQQETIQMSSSAPNQQTPIAQQSSPKTQQKPTKKEKQQQQQQKSHQHAPSLQQQQLLEAQEYVKEQTQLAKQARQQQKRKPKSESDDFSIPRNVSQKLVTKGGGDYQNNEFDYLTDNRSSKSKKRAQKKRNDDNEDEEDNDDDLDADESRGRKVANNNNNPKNNNNNNNPNKQEQQQQNKEDGRSSLRSSLDDMKYRSRFRFKLRDSNNSDPAIFQMDSENDLEESPRAAIVSQQKQQNSQQQQKQQQQPQPQGNQQQPQQQPQQPQQQQKPQQQIVYKFGKIIQLEEDREHEFKSLESTSNPEELIARHCKKYVNAFLNTQGGTLYFGVKDDGSVMGFASNRKMRDLIRLKIDGIVSTMTPQVDPNLVSVRFVKVQNPPTRILHSDEELVILEVGVRKGRAPIYLVNKTTAYYRLSGSTREFDEETIHERQQLGRPMEIGRVVPMATDFIGRDEELNQIRGFVLSPQVIDPLKIVILTGGPLVGKSTLAKRLAVEFSSLYADHQFYVDYKGCTSHYINEQDALVTVIRTAYPKLPLPTTPGEVRGLYESCFANKKCLLLVENVGTGDQIKNVLPHSARNCLVIVTSRKQFVSLPTELENSLILSLGALKPADASLLFKSIHHSIVDNNNAPSEAQIDQICKLCGYLPLPIRVVASTMSRNSALTTSKMIEQLSNDSKRNEMFESAFSSIYDSCEPEVLEAMMPLTLFESGFESGAASFVWNQSYDDSEDLLGEILDNGLVEFDGKSLRYQLNDLVRAHFQFMAQKNAKYKEWVERFIRYYLSWMKKLRATKKVELSISQTFEMKNLETASQLAKQLDHESSQANNEQLRKEYDSEYKQFYASYISVT